MDARLTVLRYFSACPLCGHFLASLLALLGDESLDSALEKEKGPWLDFEWHPAIGGMLTSYYDWHLGPDTEEHSGRCPSCLRRITYRRTDVASLQIERRPGSRV